MANKKVKKQKKLQKWLQEKAKREQDALDAQLELEDAKRKAMEEAERLRLKRNRENKEKLAQWREKQINELQALLGHDGDADYGTTM